MVISDGHDYCTLAEACAALGVKPATLHNYISRGVLHSYRQGMGRQRLYRRSEIDALLTVRESGQRAASRPMTIPRAEDWIPYTG